jgi:hypothetical protein
VYATIGLGAHAAASQATPTGGRALS